ncbi:hypothetical protein ACIHAX_36955 [Nocardia sp. NPDC051929]|uniref:hypothetical protein n=1 Tax=unclassified Nocardia TaxID=2637762 RepID=UPI00344099B3
MTANALQCYVGTAPVTRRSGRSEFVVNRRLAHNATSALRSIDGRSAACAPPNGHSSYTTPRSPKANSTTVPCARWPTGGSTSCGTA